MCLCVCVYFCCEDGDEDGTKRRFDRSGGVGSFWKDDTGEDGASVELEMYLRLVSFCLYLFVTG